MAGETKSAPERTRAGLLVVHSREEGAVGRFTPMPQGVDRATLGRSGTGLVSLWVDTVARVHVVLTRQAGRWWAADSGSTNGSFVNRKRLDSRARHALANGDVLDVGGVLLRYLEGEPLDALVDEARAHFARVDALTDVAVEGVLAGRLADALAEAREARFAFRPAVVVVNVDLRRVTEHEGCLRADAVVVALARRVAAEGGDANTGRDGHDGFVVLVAREGRDRASEIASKIFWATRAPFDAPGGAPVAAPVWVGMASADDGDDATTLLARARDACSPAC